jgi:type IV secretion system protein VirB8
MTDEEKKITSEETNNSAATPENQTSTHNTTQTPAQAAPAPAQAAPAPAQAAPAPAQAAPAPAQAAPASVQAAPAPVQAAPAPTAPLQSNANTKEKASTNDSLHNSKNRTQKKLSKKAKAHNWYRDRHMLIMVQRNFFLLSTILLLIITIVGLVHISFLSKNKSIEPFVVEIEDKSGIPTVVDQKTKKEYTADASIQNYFIYKYIKAREGFNMLTYKYDYYQTVRLLSTPTVYYYFQYAVRPRNETSPINIYGRRVTLIPKIKSVVSYNEKKQIRILIQHIQNRAVIKEEHKIITLNFQFRKKELKFKDRLVDPLGFTITEYIKSDDHVVR